MNGASITSKAERKYTWPACLPPCQVFFGQTHPNGALGRGLTFSLHLLLSPFDTPYIHRPGLFIIIFGAQILFIQFEPTAR